MGERGKRGRGRRRGEKREEKGSKLHMTRFFSQTPSAPKEWKLLKGQTRARGVTIFDVFLCGRKH